MISLSSRKQVLSGISSIIWLDISMFSSSLDSLCQVLQLISGTRVLNQQIYVYVRPGIERGEVSCKTPEVSGTAYSGPLIDINKEKRAKERISLLIRAKIQQRLPVMK